MSLSYFIQETLFSISKIRESFPEHALKFWRGDRNKTIKEEASCPLFWMGPTKNLPDQNSKKPWIVFNNLSPFKESRQPIGFLNHKSPFQLNVQKTPLLNLNLLFDPTVSSRRIQRRANSQNSVQTDLDCTWNSSMLWWSHQTEEQANDNFCYDSMKMDYKILFWQTHHLASWSRCDGHQRKDLDCQAFSYTTLSAPSHSTNLRTYSRPRRK